MDSPIATLTLCDTSTRCRIVLHQPVRKTLDEAIRIVRALAQMGPESSPEVEAAKDAAESLRRLLSLAAAVPRNGGREGPEPQAAEQLDSRQRQLPRGSR